MMFYNKTGHTKYVYFDTLQSYYTDKYNKYFRVYLLQTMKDLLKALRCTNDLCVKKFKM